MSEKRLPTLQPGDSHMESLIEAAIQGHASTRDAMRWLVRQLVPATQPAEATDYVVRDAERYRWLLCNYLKFHLPDEAWKHGSLDAAIDAAMLAAKDEK